VSKNNLQRQEPLKRNFRSFRLFPADRSLLQNLGRGNPKVPDRHTALLQLVPIVRDLEIPKKKGREPIRIGIPNELADELTKRSGETGHTVQDILLAAARVYRDRHPLPDRKDE